jgi:D-lactate dehydrogenase
MTRHLINRENVGYIKRGAYLVNTARGGIVETAALVHALQEGILAGAGLDVLEEEGDTKDEMKFLSQTNPREATMRVLLENHALMRMPNVLITPHNAFNSEEAFQRILETTMKNIETFIAGKPVNLIP